MHFQQILRETKSKSAKFRSRWSKVPRVSGPVELWRRSGTFVLEVLPHLLSHVPLCGPSLVLQVPQVHRGHRVGALMGSGGGGGKGVGTPPRLWGSGGAAPRGMVWGGGTWGSHGPVLTGTGGHLCGGGLSERGTGRPRPPGPWQSAAMALRRLGSEAGRKWHIPPHSAQPQHTNDWAPRTRKRHQQEHRPQRPTERSDPTQHAKGRAGDCPGPRKGATMRRHVTRGGGSGQTGPPFQAVVSPVPPPSNAAQPPATTRE